MSTQRRILSSRANGRRSKGPITAAGKARSAQNAIRHGILARHLLLEGEQPLQFAALLNAWVAHIGPEDMAELGMVEEIVSDLWRYQRSRAIETRMLKDATPPEDSDSTPMSRMALAYETLEQQGKLAPIHRYQVRLHSLYRRSLRDFELLKALKSRNPNDPNPISEQLPEPEPATAIEEPTPPSADPPPPQCEPAPPPAEDAPPQPTKEALLRSLITRAINPSIQPLFQQDKSRAPSESLIALPGGR